MGGTFEVIHRGHERLITTALRLSDQVLIGVTSDELSRRLKKRHYVSPFRQRKARLLKYLAALGAENRTHIAKIDDKFGPPQNRRDFNAIVATIDTLETARRLNRLREKKGLEALDLILVPLVRGQDGKRISTTRILKREIDTRGRVLRTNPKNWRRLTISKKLDS